MRYIEMPETTLPEDIKETAELHPCVICKYPTRFYEISSKRYLCSEDCKYALYKRCVTEDFKEVV